MITRQIATRTTTGCMYSLKVLLFMFLSTSIHSLLEEVIYERCQVKFMISIEKDTPSGVWTPES